eukprot:7620717-Pyramimonas_sp.AAC.1
MPLLPPLTGALADPGGVPALGAVLAVVHAVAAAAGRRTVRRPRPQRSICGLRPQRGVGGREPAARGQEGNAHE